MSETTTSAIVDRERDADPPTSGPAETRRASGRAGRRRAAPSAAPQPCPRSRGRDRPPTPPSERGRRRPTSRAGEDGRRSVRRLAAARDGRGDRGRARTRARASSTSSGEIDVPDGYTRARGHADAATAARSPSSSRASTAASRTGCSPARSTRSRRPGVAPDAVTVVPVPGAFELPLAAMALAKTRRYACVVALGAIVRGETPHFDYVASEAASGLQLAAIETGVPVAFGVLTVETRRAGRGADRPRRRRGADRARDGRLFAQLRASARELDAAPSATLAGRCPRSAQSVARSPGSDTTARTRWSRRTGASTRTSSASACS